MARYGEFLWSVTRTAWQTCMQGSVLPMTRAAVTGTLIVVLMDLEANMFLKNENDKFVTKFEPTSRTLRSILF